jgi:GTP-binding protein EngB required for normal cell division
MTIKELIEMLQEYDENCEVVLSKWDTLEYEIDTRKIESKQTLESRENWLQYTVIIY